jgi:hypothetical protein
MSGGAARPRPIPMDRGRRAVLASTVSAPGYGAGHRLPATFADGPGDCLGRSDGVAVRRVPDLAAPTIPSGRRAAMAGGRGWPQTSNSDDPKRPAGPLRQGRVNHVFDIYSLGAPPLTAG